MTFEFDVITALHDDVKTGFPCPRKRVRVLVSSVEFPDWRVAAQVAACMAVATNGGMAIDVLPRV